MEPEIDGIAATESVRLARFVSSVTDYAIYMLSPEGTVTSWNAGAERFKGYRAQEIIGAHFSRFYTPEDNAAGLPRRALQLALQNGKFEAEGWRVRKDGSRFWAHVVIDPIRDADGSLAGFTKITRDITDKHATEQRLRDSEQRFRMLVEGVTDYAIYMLSPDGAVTNWNAGAHRIKGYEADEVIGTHFSRFYPAEERAAGAPAAALEAARATGRFEAEGRRVRKDGSEFMAHVVIDAIRDDRGALVGFAKITRDITERRTARAQLEAAREALYQAQKLEAIGKVTGGVAHDFNNLLGVVSNGLALLRRRPDPADNTRLIHTMEQAIRRGATLVQQLLAFARQQPLAKTNQHVNGIVQGFEAVLRRACSEGIEFELALAPQLPPVLVDTAQVESALLNLVTNACDLDVQARRITLATALLQLDAGQVGNLPPGRYVSLAVRDDGAGMSETTRAHAIEPFFTTKPAGRGTGLGLSQVYGMVQQSDGELTIESAEGRGTTVTMYFPASDGPVEHRRPDDVETVLVVDDQPEVLDMTGELFRNLGFEVLSADSGERALELLRETPRVSLLFSDVVMGGMNGVELAQRAVGEQPQLKVILASGYPGADGELPVDGRLVGFPFIAKPYQLNDVIRKLRALT